MTDEKALGILAVSGVRWAGFVGGILFAAFAIAWMAGFNLNHPTIGESSIWGPFAYTMQTGGDLSNPRLVAVSVPESMILQTRWIDIPVFAALAFLVVFLFRAMPYGLHAVAAGALIATSSLLLWGLSPLQFFGHIPSNLWYWLFGGCAACTTVGFLSLKAMDKPAIPYWGYGCILGAAIIFNVAWGVPLASKFIGIHINTVILGMMAGGLAALTLHFGSRRKTYVSLWHWLNNE
jgi:hypothetical protein